MGRVRAAHGCACRLLIGGACLLAVAPALAQRPGEPVFAADVRLVTLPVTVTDAHGAPLGDLEREDFRILEEGNPREVAVFERRTNRPLSVALMLDASLSAAIELRYERQSAARFLANLLGPESLEADNAAVFSFSGEVTALSPFTGELGQLESALERVRAEDGTSLYAAILLASEELAGREGRRVIVLITDGGDTTSGVRFADALRAAHEAEAAIYPLIVLPIQSDTGRNRGGEHALITLARLTGGEAFVQHGAEDLDRAFGQILRNLRTQYLLAFYPQDDQVGTPERFRKIEVEVARTGAAALVRSGYYAPPVPPPMPDRPRTPRARVQTLPQAKPPRVPAVTADGPEEKDEPPQRPPEGQRRPPIVRPPP